MKKSIYIVSTASGSGKTAICIGLYLTLKKNGENPGYFKSVGDPFSDVKVTKADKDVNVIHRMLERKYSMEEICPIFISPTAFLDEIHIDKVAGVKDLIKTAFDEMSSKVDYLIVEGNHSFSQFYSLSLDDINFAKLYGSEVVLVSRYENDGDFDRLLLAIEKIKEHNLNFKGVIFSNVKTLQAEKLKKEFPIIFKDQDVELLGIIPSSRLLAAPTIGEVLEATGGTVLTEDFLNVKDNLVENFIIGAMQCNDALTYMRKSEHLGVITGGDRSDIILTAVELGVSLIILTGNLKPEVIALAKAKEKGVPIILVSSDTYQTAHNIQNINIHIQQGEIELCQEQVAEHVDWKKLL